MANQTSPCPRLPSIDHQYQQYLFFGAQWINRFSMHSPLFSQLIIFINLRQPFRFSRSLRDSPRVQVNGEPESIAVFSYAFASSNALGWRSFNLAHSIFVERNKTYNHFQNATHNKLAVQYQRTLANHKRLAYQSHVHEKVI